MRKQLHTITLNTVYSALDALTEKWLIRRFGNLVQSDIYDGATTLTARVLYVIDAAR